MALLASASGQPSTGPTKEWQALQAFGAEDVDDLIGFDLWKFDKQLQRPEVAPWSLVLMQLRHLARDRHERRLRTLTGDPASVLPPASQPSSSSSSRTPLPPVAKRARRTTGEDKSNAKEQHVQFLVEYLVQMRHHPYLKDGIPTEPERKACG